MSVETLEYHHGKHHRAYVDKVNAMTGEQGFGEVPLTILIRQARAHGNDTLFNNSAQIWNHNFFWQCLAPPDGQRPTGMLGEMIDQTFGSVEDMLEKLKEEAIGHFSNSWVWLILDRDQLRITSLHDADTPVVHDGMKPLLTLDLWEHAYYVDYRNDREAFAGRVLENIINWEFIAQNLDGNGISRADLESRS